MDCRGKNQEKTKKKGWRVEIDKRAGIQKEREREEQRDKEEQRDREEIKVISKIHLFLNK